jgi:hypothetical protein
VPGYWPVRGKSGLGRRTEKIKEADRAFAGIFCPGTTAARAAGSAIGPLYPMKLNTVGAKKPKARSAAPMAPNPTLSHTSAVISVMMAADASTIAI